MYNLKENTDTFYQYYSKTRLGTTNILKSGLYNWIWGLSYDNSALDFGPFALNGANDFILILTPNII